MSKDLPADRILSHTLLIHADLVGAWVDADYTRGETVLEFCCQVNRHWFFGVEDDEGKNAVGSRGYIDKMIFSTSITTQGEAAATKHD